MERSITFYRDLVGMEVAWDSKAEGVRFSGPQCDQITGCPGAEQRHGALAPARRTGRVYAHWQASG